MRHSHNLFLTAGVCSAALVLTMPASAQDDASASPAAASSTMEGEIVVTAQRRAESLQAVPIAVSAFGSDALEAQKISGGPDLQTGVPNVTFSQGMRGDNITIRGIGTKVFTGSSDSGTGVHFNSAPMTDNRLFEMDLYDIERLEVLRGPQGTLYGRNATGGVINVIAARPIQEFEASARAEFSSFEGRKFRGMVNIPVVDDLLAVRVAASSFDRDGYVTNVLNDRKIDGRSLYSFRATVGLTPSDRIDAYFTWQRFRENDDRLLTGKAVCVADNGPSSVGTTSVTDTFLRTMLSQGCANERLSPKTSTDLPNSLTTFIGLAAYNAGLAPGNVFAGQRQIKGYENVAAAFNPSYVARQDVFQGGISWEVSDTLQIDYLGSYQKGSVESQQDGLLVQAEIPFVDSALFPGGVVRDPQLGASDRLSYVNANRRVSKQHFHELRMGSDFDGKFNFSLGTNYMDYRLDQDLGVYSHALTAYAHFLNGGNVCAANATNCIYIDPDPTLWGEGHNYFRSTQPYHLKSYAAFGEIYYNFTDTLKLTAGARYTRDDKQLENISARLLNPGSGYPRGNPTVFDASFKALTGRVGLDWKPNNDTLVYGFASRGYKGGGFNPVASNVAPQFKPEYINALELGTKNTLLNGKMTLNASAFYYDYKNYQISKYVERVLVTENVDARVFGVEVEVVARPMDGLRFNFVGGLLNTKIKSGRSLDLFDRTQGDPNLTVVKNSGASVCTVPTTAMADFIAIIQQDDGAPNISGVSGNPRAIYGVCSGTYANMGLIPTVGVEANLAGKELPNAPNWTITAGAEYEWSISDSWTATVRGDYYRQGSTYSRPYNTAVDYMPGWGNLNLSLKLSELEQGLDLEFYVKNVTNSRAVTDYIYNDDSLGLTARAYLREPRIYAISVSKQF